MRRDLLEVLHCPRCRAGLSVEVIEEDIREISQGSLICSGRTPHRYDIHRGIVRMAEGFTHASVKRELEYLDTTYAGDPRLTDARVITGFPKTLPLLWPKTAHFGIDFAALIERLPPVTPRTWVLDVGTSACWTSRLLSERGGHVVALDVTESNYYGLNAAHVQFEAHGVYFDRVLESMTHLPFRNGSLDGITFNASFHHTPDLERTLAECHRTLKPGGLVGMVNESMISLRHRLFYRQAHSDSGSHHDVSFADFETAAKRAGFSIRYHLAQHVKNRIQAAFPASLAGYRALSSGIPVY